MKKRSLERQFTHAICTCMHLGESKRQYRMDHHGSTERRLFSIDNVNKLRGTTKQLANFIDREYPGVIFAKDITNEMLQRWLDSNRNNWSKATMYEKASQLKVIFKLVECCYKCYPVCDPFTLELPEIAPMKKRSVMIKEEHLIMIRNSFEERDSKSVARIGVELAMRFGLRAKESSCLSPENIDIANMKIHIVEGAKNGKKRDVPIRPKDLEYARALKVMTNGQRYVCGGSSRDVINLGIRREMKRLGIDVEYPDTTTHAIRKFYAVERYSEELDRGLDEISAWEIVQKELGHGDKFRLPLFRAYIQEPIDNSLEVKEDCAFNDLGELVNNMINIEEER